ncbi:hypothetical protein EDD17DRAFT_1512194 [Pisolithus thermaeus]|nr:hypothetical protein EDD17DRAFT_1512194 [Pisolithus thermaeus]
MVNYQTHAKTTHEGSEPSRAVKPPVQGHQALDTWKEHTKCPLTMWNDVHGRDEHCLQQYFGTSFARKSVVIFQTSFEQSLILKMSQGFGAPEFLMGLVPIKSYLGDI